MPFLSEAMTAFVGIGSNLEQPHEQNLLAQSEISSLSSVKNLVASSCYSSSPVGDTDQPNFVNSVAKVEVVEGPSEFLHQLQQIEQKMGRVRDVANRNAARIIDIDILIYADLIVDSLNLTIPHPRLAERKFVLYPLRELEKKLAISIVVPGFGSIQSLIEHGSSRGYFKHQSIEKLS